MVSFEELSDAVKESIPQNISCKAEEPFCMRPNEAGIWFEFYISDNGKSHLIGESCIFVDSEKKEIFWDDFYPYRFFETERGKRAGTAAHVLVLNELLRLYGRTIGKFQVYQESISKERMAHLKAMGLKQGDSVLGPDGDYVKEPFEDFFEKSILYAIAKEALPEEMHGLEFIEKT